MKQPESITVSGHCSFLQRRYPSRFKLARGIIGPVPLADLVLLLILFVVAHSWIVMRPGIRMELPEVEFLDGARRGASLVTVTAGNLIFFGDQRTSLAGLGDQLRRARAVAGEDAALLIQADRGTMHELVMQIYAVAATAGFEEVILATQLPSPEEPMP